jgi:hypothetical protein
MEEGSDPMLLKGEFYFPVPPPRTTLSALDTACSPPSVAAMVQASASMAQDEPSSGDDIVPVLPASSEERLGCFLGAIQKKPASLLLAAPARPAVQPAPSEAPSAAAQDSPTTNALEF